MQLLAAGRTAEVYSYGETEVLKLARPRYTTHADHEARILAVCASLALPVPKLIELVWVDGRRGMVLERIEGRSLTDVIAGSTDIDALAAAFAQLQAGLQVQVPTEAPLPDLVDRLDHHITVSLLPPELIGDLRDLLVSADSGERVLCHFDLHPDNVIVTDRGWIVVDWLDAAVGPHVADVARSLVLRADTPDLAVRTFMSLVQRHGQRERSQERLPAWLRIVAAARCAEGFRGPYAGGLAAVAAGAPLERLRRERP